MTSETGILDEEFLKTSVKKMFYELDKDQDKLEVILNKLVQTVE